MAAMAQLHCSLRPRNYYNVPCNHAYNNTPAFSFLSDSSVIQSRTRSLSLFHTDLTRPSFLAKSELSLAGGGDGGDGVGRGGGGGGGGDSGGWSDDRAHGDDDSSSFGVLGLFLKGWRSRVAADPQFPFKVLMEELVGVSACVLGDMASRPNFGLNELDFVFSTLVVGSILNFTLMYLLAPTAAAGVAAKQLPAIFSSCPTSHMFEPGAFTVLDRLGTFVYKGTVFAAVGLAAGLVGTALSNGLIKLRKKMDPEFETPNKAPPTLLNALTWAIHMGVSSNLRYQTLNGVEFVLAKGLPPLAFKSSVVVLRCLNNVLGGVSFVILARATGSQSIEQPKAAAVELDSADEKEKLLEGDKDEELK
ncbi:protein RETICULATA-RELATED 3, chloroplastic [Momordica charantia]|uniref:Protein RETICULATA-RELATED 3, chloroplastic n=1 Tax=Momordica charantia TaxID=3673 RepID=A0A6J1DQ40_MOMCH|nr:protein RETICULATA-RELATED 3, chloroplastic [Momordica charantia]